MSNKVEYKSLTIPQLRWSSKSLDDFYGELVAQPLEPGFGMTLGNSLRRVLLGAIEGSAVTSVIIKGVNNEFSVIPGIVEDTMQIVLNIKEIVVKNKEGRPGKMLLNVKGEGVARVSDIKADDHLELINKDHVIANISQGGELDIEFFVESGRGYKKAQWPIGQVLQKDNRIYLDAMFSPVKKIYFDVEKTRVGEDIDFDKLIVKIYTDGSETPKDALHYCVSVLRTQLEHFLAVPEIPFNEFSKIQVVEKAEEVKETKSLVLESVSPEFLLKPIDELELSARAHNCLLSAGKKRIIDIVNLSEDEALKLKNFGRKSLKEVKDSMKAFGLNFGMNISEKDLKKD